MNFFDFLRRKNAATAKKKAERAALKGERTVFLLEEKTPFAVTEAFRNLKMTLSVAVAKEHDGTGTSFLCASSYPSEGKTTIAANTALMLAQSDVKVVLVDTDLRMGRISKFFNFPSKPGLSDYLSGHASLDEIVHQTDVNPNLYVICRGTHTARPYELLADKVFKELNEELKKSYAYVIFDSSPFRLVSDALAVATVADGTFLVARHNYSYESDIRAAADSLRFVKANILGIVVNDYLPDSPKKSAYYNHYYNSYSYGSECAKQQDAE